MNRRPLPCAATRLVFTATCLLGLQIAGCGSDQPEQQSADVSSQKQPLATGARDKVAQTLVSKAAAQGRVRVIAELHSDAGIDSKQAALLAELSGSAHQVTRQFQTIRFIALEVGLDALSRLASSVQVAGVEEDVASPALLRESVPLLQADQSWNAGFDGTGLAVAVLDTGVERTHSFLQNKVVAEACFSGTNSCPNGTSRQVGPDAARPCAYADAACPHGTHVAGIAAGRGTDFSGVARGASLIAVQVFSRFAGNDCRNAGEDPCALTYTSDQVAALEHVFSLRNTHRIAAVNMSLGSGMFTSQSDCDRDNASRKAVIDNLRAAGIATVIASGNNGATNALSAPGCISSAISVGSTTKNDMISVFSSSASFLTLLAPGQAINSSFDGGFSALSGTSMAAPHVAGAIAILKQRSPELSVDELRSVLRDTGLSITDARNGVSTPRIRVNQALLAHRRLTVSKSGSGDGIIMSGPAGLDCGPGCARSFRTGTSVTLTAYPSPSGRSDFTGWSGCASSSEFTCQVPMNNDRQVTASFACVRTYRQCYDECRVECLESSQPASRCLPYCSNLCRSC